MNFMMSIDTGVLMRVYFFRHGLAEPHDEAGILDHQRKLTEVGIARVTRAARAMRVLGLKPARLYSSPLIRARQTADILAQTLGIAVQVRSEVGPGFDGTAVGALVRDLGQDDEAIFVGHEPDFSQAIKELTGACIELKKGGMARVDIDTYHPLRGKLIWLIAPKLFDEIG
ncbi:MAG: histidine phosphatase family protein [Chloroflexota bacterium]|nr:histidine phosphatase family protein [Chloroflexota bacterium]